MSQEVCNWPVRLSFGTGHSLLLLGILQRTLNETHHLFIWRQVPSSPVQTQNFVLTELAASRTSDPGRLYT
jgi:hypothetical protein